MKKILAATLFIIIAASAVWYFFIKSDEYNKGTFTFAEISRGDISNTITSTGTLEALLTIDVGTQVSGKIKKIFVDFNSNVKKGQILAILDTTSLALQVSDAQSGLLKAQAQYEQAKVQYNNSKVLYDKAFLSEVDFLTSKTALEIALSNLQSAKTTLQRARTNLGYAYIYSPISGKIISRNVEEGQTVAASFQAPTLFLIAEDLSKMQILAAVDESDIGQIKVGQDAKFSVQAYPDKQFDGKVVQTRLNSQVVSNVVNYTVVIHSENKDNLLLPGMTATIDFYIQQVKDVLLIPNSALKFQPTEDMLTEYKSEMKNSPNNNTGFRRNKAFNSNNRGGIRNNKNNIGRVWYLNVKSEPRVSMAFLGLTDGKNTEIVRSRTLKEGMKVITSIISGDESQTNYQNVLNSRKGLPRGLR